MPFTLKCPNCRAGLNSPVEIPTGKSIRCPRCKTEFKVTNQTGNNDDVQHTAKRKNPVGSSDFQG